MQEPHIEVELTMQTYGTPANCCTTLTLPTEAMGVVGGGTMPMGPAEPVWTLLA